MSAPSTVAELAHQAIERAIDVQLAYEVVERALEEQIAAIRALRRKQLVTTADLNRVACPHDTLKDLEAVR